MAKIILLLICFLLIGCSSLESIEIVRINDHFIGVEIADSDAERAKGLMYRESLREEEGMLFIFETESEKSFWMKNTLIPLDMIFINSDKEIVDIVTMQPCKEDPCETYTSKQDALYVLEVNAGFAEQNNIGIGDIVRW